MHPNDPPPFLDFGDGDGSDDVVSTASSHISVLCPLTQQLLVDPVKNTHCLHVYSKQAILSYILNIQRCPVSGCNRPVSAHSLVSATEVLQRIEHQHYVEALRKYLSMAEDPAQNPRLE